MDDSTFKIARDINTEVPTVQSYLIFSWYSYWLFLTHIMNPFENGKDQSKFYDLGVKRSLSANQYSNWTNEFSVRKCFEHFIVSEIYRLIKYFQPIGNVLSKNHK